MSQPQFYAPRMEHWRMTSARYDIDLLGTDLARTLVDKVERLTDNINRKLVHIDAAYPGFVEAVQHGMRPGARDTVGFRSSDVSDRTYVEVARRSHGHDLFVQLASLAAEADGIVRQIEKLVTSQRREADAYDLEQVKKAHRCQGDPTCQSIALQDGLCGPCRAAGYRSGIGQRAGGLRPADGRTGPRTDVSRLYEAIGIKDHGAIAGAPRLLDTSRIIEREAS